MPTTPDDEALDLYAQASYAGAVPHDPILDEAVDARVKARYSDSIANQRAQTTVAGRNGLNSPSDAYILSNNGLAALPHIQNDGD